MACIRHSPLKVPLNRVFGALTLIWRKMRACFRPPPKNHYSPFAVLRLEMCDLAGTDTRAKSR